MAEINHIPMRILLVEDSQSDAYLFRAWLEEPDKEKYEIHHVTSVADAVAMLEKYTFRAILLDLTLPDAHGLEGLNAVHNMSPTTPVIILTGLDSEHLALKAVESGAQDYLVKDKANGGTIIRSINYAIHRKNFESSIIRQANFDKLTGLANRTLFDSRLTMALGRAMRSGSGIALLFLDLNEFKKINDTLGHLAGDQLLREVGRRISRCVRPYDTAARLGGDEFAVLTEGVTKPRDCMTIALKLIEEITAPVTIDTQEVKVGVSIGIETCTGLNILPPETIINHADEAMYSAKLKKGSAYCFYTQNMEEITKRRIRMETELRQAIQNDELMLCYQPRQCAETGKTCGVQALIRWNHPERGLILPQDFLGLAKDINMLEEIERWVLAKVCEDIQRWRKIALPFIQVSVNLSSKLFDTPSFLDLIQSLLKETGVESEQLSFELPENAFLIPDETRINIFTQLYRMGIGITMNQFNIQTSSLQSLKAMTLGEIKLAQDCICGIGEDSKDLAMIKAIIGCAHSLGLKVIACGVESEELRTQLKEAGCDTIQGFIFSRPMPAAYLEKWLQLGGNALSDHDEVSYRELRYNS